ncbi:MAG: hypothetical protein ABI687_07160 [Flavitalea sp.]
MNPYNERKSSRRSAGFIISAVIGLLMVIAIFWGTLSGSRKTQLSEMADKLAEEKMALRQNIRLHERFSQLQRLDEKYGALLMASAPAQQLDSISRMIIKSEEIFNKSIDSIGKEAAKFNAWANVVMLDSVMASFRLALSNRQMINSVRNALAGQPLSLGADEKKMLQWENDLHKKEEKIKDLENKLRQRTNQETAQSKPEELAKQESGSLQQALTEEEIRSAKLLDINNAQKQDIEQLSAQLAKEKRSSAYDDANMKTVKNKNASLEEEVDELTAELNFARIDCNLTRADAKKIISNSRQRKELLAEALQTLEALAQSDNTNTKKKVKDKIGELNQIASTVRD